MTRGKEKVRAGFYIEKEVLEMADSLLPAANVPHLKVQPLIPQLRRQSAAAGDHIRFQIQARDPDVSALYLVQIVVHGKRQIRLPTAKINNADLAA